MFLSINLPFNLNTVIPTDCSWVWVCLKYDKYTGLKFIKHLFHVLFVGTICYHYARRVWMAKLAKYFILSLSCGTKVAKFEADRAILNTTQRYMSGKWPGFDSNKQNLNAFHMLNKLKPLTRLWSDAKHMFSFLKFCSYFKANGPDSFHFLLKVLLPSKFISKSISWPLKWPR